MFNSIYSVLFIDHRRLWEKGHLEKNRRDDDAKVFSKARQLVDASGRCLASCRRFARDRVLD